MYMMTATLRGRQFGFTVADVRDGGIPTDDSGAHAVCLCGERRGSHRLCHLAACYRRRHGEGVHEVRRGVYLIGEQVADGSICVLDNLDFGTAEAGRIYYTTTTTAAQESVKMSAPFEAERAEQSSPATEVSFEKYSHPGSVTSSNGSDIYTTLTVRAWSPGMWCMSMKMAHRRAIPEPPCRWLRKTSVLLRNIRVTRAGGTLSMQVKRTGGGFLMCTQLRLPLLPSRRRSLTLDALDVRGEKLAGVCYGIYNEAEERISEITTAESGGSVSLPWAHIS